MSLPVLPYAGTSGHSGGDTSRERAEREDSDGTTGARQSQVLGLLDVMASEGMTWKDLADLTNWHHGQSSGALSTLHKAGKIARLTERRNRCFVYVLPEYVNGRETMPHGRAKKECRLTQELAYKIISDAIYEARNSGLTITAAATEAAAQIMQIVEVDRG